MIGLVTHKKGYLKSYYRKNRKEIIDILGKKCKKCGSISELHIHHKKPIKAGQGRGSLWRLTEWKRNLKNLEVLCSNCHKDNHYKNRRIDGYEYGTEGKDRIHNRS